MSKIKNLILLLPSSLLEDCSDNLTKTIKVGLIARALSIFKINNITIYNTQEKKANKNSIFIKTILDYMDTPQYLRKILFPLKDELKNAGLLSPLETPHHKRMVEWKKIKTGEVRQGVIVKKDKRYSYADVGLEKLIPIPNLKLPINKRLNIKIKIEKKSLSGSIVSDPDEYWGYKTIISNDNLIETLKKMAPDLIIGTSKYGELITDIYEVLSRNLDMNTKIAIVFGSPYTGIYKIVKNKNEINDIFNYLINFIPNQSTRTIRTEESIFITLGIINFLISK
jgi:predicted SPOUT superfamily RNA methylase MTH1